MMSKNGIWNWDGCRAAFAAMVCAASLLTTLRASAAPPTPYELTYSDDHFLNNLLLYVPQDTCGPFPVVIYIHGGGWVSGDKSSVSQYVNDLLARGFAVASVNYRMSFHAVFPAQVFDCKGAIRYLRANAATYDLDPDHFGVFGESAGGYLASMVGTTNGDADLEGDVGGNLGQSSDVQSFAELYGHTDLVAHAIYEDYYDSESSKLIGHPIVDIIAHWAEPGYAAWVALVTQAGPINHASADDPPSYLLHGLADEAILPSQAQSLFDQLTAAGADSTLRLMLGIAHEFPNSEKPAVWNFLQQTLGDSRLMHVKFGGGEGDKLGTSVAILGDLDGDGKAEFAAGSPFADGNGTDAGMVTIYSGATGAVKKKLNGAAAGDRFGSAIAAAGDVNHDGTPDLIVGAPRSNANGSDSGAAYVYSGATWAKLFTFKGEKPGDRFGSAVAGAGRVNDDNRDDLIVGAPYNDTKGSSSGRAYVYSGANGAVLKTIHGAKAGDKLGWSVGGGGDMNNDGRDDVIVGAPYADNGGTNAGRIWVYAYSGSTWITLFSRNGSAPGDQLGLAVAGAGDVNNDGFDDVVVGAPGSDAGASNSGEALVLGGPGGSLLATLLPSSPQTGQMFGSAVAPAGDVDEDGLDDVLVASSARDECSSGNGEVMLFVSSGGSTLSPFHTGFLNAFMGRSIAGGKDINGDGIPDLVIGSDGRASAGLIRGGVEAFSPIPLH